MKFATRGLTVLATVTAVIAAGAVSTATAQASVPQTSAARKAARAVAHPYVHHKTERVCSTVARAHRATCFAIRQTDTVQPTAFKTRAVVPNAIPAGYAPANLVSAYKLSTSSSGGSGVTVAIVDAYNDSTAAADLAIYRSQYGLPACTVVSGCLRIVNQSGATTPLPADDAGWAAEESLDLDMVSAVCPNCKILLVEANSASDSDLYAAEDRAVTMGAKFVSNSWGGPEYSSQTNDDAHFNHPGVAVTVSTGDNGTGAAYPATSRYVTAVGGTSLRTASSVRGWTESAWSGAGSGCSSYDTKPTWQTVTTSCAKRAEADVSAVADPSTGVAVYQGTGSGGAGWAVYGGTSASAPIVASVYALAGTPGPSDYPAAYSYSHPANLFDVTTGNNGTCGVPVCTAGTGWDGPTGLGTPNGTAAFVAGGTSTVTVANPGSKTAAVGTAITSFTLTASGGSTYAWTATGLPPGLSIGSSTGTISGTPTTAGTYSVTAKATSGAQSGTATFTITVNPSGGGGCVTGQKLANPGFESGYTSWTATSGVIGQYASSGQPIHAGTWDAWLDGYGATHTDTLSQSVTIPAGCTNSTLSFFLHIDTAETTTTVQYDTLTVTIGSTTVATYSNLNKAGGYVLRSVPAGTFAGQTVVVKFNGVEDGSLQTSFVVDDTALNAS